MLAQYRAAQTYRVMCMNPWKSCSISNIVRVGARSDVGRTWVKADLEGIRVEARSDGGRTWVKADLEGLGMRG